MYLTRCPNCGELSAVAPDDVGRVVKCSRCPASYPAEVNASDNTREAFVQHVREKIDSAAAGLIVLGLFGIACALLPMTLLGVQTATAYEDIGGNHGELLLALIALTCSLLLSGVVMYAGTQMQRVRYYPLCVLAAVLVMLPFSNLCFPLGWLTGPIALYWLRKPEVRRAFALNRGEGDERG